MAVVVVVVIVGFNGKTKVTGPGNGERPPGLLLKRESYKLKKADLVRNPNRPSLPSHRRPTCQSTYATWDSWMARPLVEFIMVPYYVVPGVSNRLVPCFSRAASYSGSAGCRETHKAWPDDWCGNRSVLALPRRHREESEEKNYYGQKKWERAKSRLHH